MSEAMSVRLELETKLGLSQEAEEALDDYIKRVAKHIVTITDGEWNSLSKTAQRWFNDVAAKVKAKSSLPEFEYLDAELQGAPDDNNEAETTGEATEIPLTAGQAAKGATYVIFDPNDSENTIIVTCKKVGKHATFFEDVDGNEYEIDNEDAVSLYVESETTGEDPDADTNGTSDIPPETNDNSLEAQNCEVGTEYVFYNPESTDEVIQASCTKVGKKAVFFTDSEGTEFELDLDYIVGSLDTGDSTADAGTVEAILAQDCELDANYVFLNPDNTDESIVAACTKIGKKAVFFTDAEGVEYELELDSAVTPYVEAEIGGREETGTEETPAEETTASDSEVTTADNCEVGKLYAFIDPDSKEAVSATCTKVGRKVIYFENDGVDYELEPTAEVSTVVVKDDFLEAREAEVGGMYAFADPDNESEVVEAACTKIGKKSVFFTDSEEKEYELEFETQVTKVSAAEKPLPNTQQEKLKNGTTKFTGFKKLGDYSVVKRIREIVARNLDYTKDEVNLILAKEGLVCSPNTLSRVIKDTKDVIYLYTHTDTSTRPLPAKSKIADEAKASAETKKKQVSEARNIKTVAEKPAPAKKPVATPAKKPAPAPAKPAAKPAVKPAAKPAPAPAKKPAGKPVAPAKKPAAPARKK